MTSLAALLPLAWVVLVAGAGWRRAPVPAARRSGLPARPLVSAGVRRRSVLAVVGGKLLLAVPPGVRPKGSHADRIGAAVVLGSLGALAMGPVGAVLAGTAAFALPLLQSRRSAARRQRALIDDLPDVLDLLTVAVAAGLSVRQALVAVTARASGPFGAELGAALLDVERGARLAEALEGVPVRCGEVGRPLITALIDAERYGAPLATSFDVLAGDARAERRRRAETAARTLPVLLLFPLVICILPAFALLTVAPMLASGVSSLGL